MKNSFTVAFVVILFCLSSVYGDDRLEQTMKEHWGKFTVIYDQSDVVLYELYQRAGSVKIVVSDDLHDDRVTWKVYRKTDDGFKYFDGGSEKTVEEMQDKLYGSVFQGADLNTVAQTSGWFIAGGQPTPCQTTRIITKKRLEELLKQNEAIVSSMKSEANTTLDDPAFQLGISFQLGMGHMLRVLIMECN